MHNDVNDPDGLATHAEFYQMRKALLTGFTGCLVGLIVETAMIAEFVTGAHPAKGGQDGAIFATFL